VHLTAPAIILCSARLLRCSALSQQPLVFGAPLSRFWLSTTPATVPLECWQTRCLASPPTRLFSVPALCEFLSPRRSTTPAFAQFLLSVTREFGRPSALLRFGVLALDRSHSWHSDSLLPQCSLAPVIDYWGPTFPALGRSSTRPLRGSGARVLRCLAPPARLIPLFSPVTLLVHGLIEAQPR